MEDGQSCVATQQLRWTTNDMLFVRRSQCFKTLEAVRLRSHEPFFHASLSLCRLPDEMLIDVLIWSGVACNFMSTCKGACSLSAVYKRVVQAAITIQAATRCIQAVLTRLEKHYVQVLDSFDESNLSYNDHLAIWCFGPRSEDREQYAALLDLHGSVDTDAVESQALKQLRKRFTCAWTPDSEPGFLFKLW
eukprot:CAMPEP_0115878392 /NCGR_PEP_ID=MMETSP0287-20121206/26747_1 /TAXON_ID=412157 /ORGANISM="Chrysochromulina rotalis, Strain UIO044" /LENGTH=190 /DNA_ID=CAMNT_0003334001 /DNA_START=33 /DNA_END=602 /DNA_ORIENTATION=+